MFKRMRKSHLSLIGTGVALILIECSLCRKRIVCITACFCVLALVFALVMSSHFVPQSKCQFHFAFMQDTQTHPASLTRDREKKRKENCKWAKRKCDKERMRVVRMCVPLENVCVNCTLSQAKKRGANISLLAFIIGMSSVYDDILYVWMCALDKTSKRLRKWNRRHNQYIHIMMCQWKFIPFQVASHPFAPRSHFSFCKHKVIHVPINVSQINRITKARQRDSTPKKTN